MFTNASPTVFAPMSARGFVGLPSGSGSGRSM
jgi:hypothetical protein